MDSSIYSKKDAFLSKAPFPYLFCINNKSEPVANWRKVRICFVW